MQPRRRNDYSSFRVRNVRETSLEDEGGITRFERGRCARGSPRFLMAMGYECFPNRGVTLVLWDGFVTAEAWRRQALKLIDDPAFPTPTVLGDLRTVTGHNLEKLDIFDNSSLLAARVRALPQKLALVTGGKGQAPFETFQASIQGLTVQMERFDDLGAACQWLGVPREPTEASLEALRASLRSR